MLVDCEGVRSLNVTASLAAGSGIELIVGVLDSTAGGSDTIDGVSDVLFSTFDGDSAEEATGSSDDAEVGTLDVEAEVSATIDDSSGLGRTLDDVVASVGVDLKLEPSPENEGRFCI